MTQAQAMLRSEPDAFELYQTATGITEVWWDLGCGAQRLIATFVCHEMAEDWLASRKKNSPSR